MSTRNQSVSLWSGYAFFPLYLIGIVVIAGFIPPPAPSWGAEVVAAYFESRQARILAGMSVCAFASCLYIAWGVALLSQMWRMERPRFPVFTVVQGISAGVGAMFFALSPLLWLAIAFRIGHAADTVQILNDFAWISWIVSWPFFFIQAAALGLCILLSKDSVLPRWVGYLSLWFAMSMFPASGIVFFTSGPLAWNGAFGLYVPLAMFALWFNAVTFSMWKASRDDAYILELSSQLLGYAGNGAAQPVGPPVGRSQTARS